MFHLLLVVLLLLLLLFFPGLTMIRVEATTLNAEQNEN